MAFANGENVGAYRIVDQLGQGGMATVYKAYHAALDRYVAIKVMHAAFLEDPNFLARFQREARIVARLDHPHIIPIYDYAEHDGQPYLVMRFVEGEHFLPSLSDRRTRDMWLAAGGKGMADLAHERVNQILAEHQVEPLDPGVEAELERIVREVEAREARRSD